jgi:hypothetical protein
MLFDFGYLDQFKYKSNVCRHLFPICQTIWDMAKNLWIGIIFHSWMLINSSIRQILNNSVQVPIQIVIEELETLTNSQKIVNNAQKTLQIVDRDENLCYLNSSLEDYLMIQPFSLAFYFL